MARFPLPAAGERFVPLSLADQRVMVAAFQDVMLPSVGPVQLMQYR